MSRTIRVLVLEDRAEDAELAVHELRRAGYEPAWQRVETEAAYLAGLDPLPDLILADYSLPQFDAVRALALLQAHGLDVPFIMMSGTVGEDVAVTCMKQGATDYLLKDRLARLGPAVRQALEARHLRDRHRRAEEVTRGLAEFGRDLVGMLDPGRMAESIVSTVATLFRVQLAALFEPDRASGALACVAVAGSACPDRWIGRTLPAGAGVAGRALQERRAIWTADLLTDARAFGIPAWVAERVAETGYRAVAAVPLVARGEALGVLALGDVPERAFEQNEIHLLTAFADQAALALANARLHEQTRQRLRETETLLAVGRAAGATLDLTEVMRRVARQLGRVLGADMVSACVPTEDGGALRGLAGYRLPKERLDALRQLSIPLRRHPFLEEALATRRPVWSTDVPTDPRIDRGVVALLPHRSLLFVPLFAKDTPLGGLFALWWTQTRGPRADELRIVEGIGQQGALALENARLFTAATRRRREAEELARVARTLAEAPDQSTVAQRVVDSVVELFDARSATLRLLGPDGQLVLAAVAGPARALFPPGHALPPGSGAPGQAVATGRAVTAREMTEDPTIPLPADEVEWLRAAGIGGRVAVPLRGRDGAIGALTVAYDGPHDFSEAEVALAQTFADQVTVALEKAHLLEETERRRRTAESLAALGRLVSRSLDPDVVARRIVEAVRDLLSVDAATVYRLESPPGDLVALAISGDVGPTHGRPVVMPEGTGVSGLAVQEGRPVTTLDILDDPRIRLTTESRSRIEQAPNLRAGLAVPLLVQERVTGVLTLGTFAGRDFRAEEVALVQAFADHAAIALENARLYQESQRSLEELARTQAQLVQAQRLEAVGRLAAGVAHDFNNLLTVMTGRSALLLARLDPTDPLRRHVELVQKAADRATDLTRQLLAFSRQQVMDVRVLDLNDVVRGVEKILRRLIGEDVEMATVLAPDLGTVKADPGQLDQVIMNLAVNARDAMPRGGRLTIETANAHLDEAFARQHPGARAGPHVRLAVTDTGVGMDAETRARIFEPFFTTKEPGKGTGLGLATVYGIVKQSDGYIAVTSAPGQGARFEIHLPRTEAPAEPRSRAPATSPAPRGTETLLLVEDDAALRELAREVLESSGYVVLAAASGPEGLALAETHRGPIHLAVTDVVMPQLSGPDMLRRLQAGRPGLRCLFMSGYTGDRLTGQDLREAALLQKPFTPATLLARIREALDRPAPG